jgi:hypothetical protein
MVKAGDVVAAQTIWLQVGFARTTPSARPGRYRSIDLTPPLAPVTVPRRPHEQEYGGIEYGELPVNYCILLNMLCHNLFEYPISTS